MGHVRRRLQVFPLGGRQARVGSVGRWKSIGADGTTLRLWHFGCCFNGMMTTMFILSGLVAAGLVIELIAAARAPMGYQDENGFHFGQERARSADEFEFGNPS